MRLFQKQQTLSGTWVFLHGHVSHSPIDVFRRGPTFPDKPRDGQIFYLTHPAKLNGKYVFAQQINSVTIPTALFTSLVTIAKIAENLDQLKDTETLKLIAKVLKKASEFE